MGKVVLPAGAEPGAQAPQVSWAPKEHDYVEGDPLCPFSSAPWGVAFPAGMNARGGMAITVSQNLTYTRCNRKCALFVAAQDDDPKDEAHKAKGRCALAGRT